MESDAMAAPEEEAEAECPFCDYTGSVPSVEAHITGSSGGEHGGELGANHRATLESQVGEEADGPEYLPESGDGKGVPVGPFVLAFVVVAGVLYLIRRSQEGGRSGADQGTETEEVEGGGGLI